MNLAISLAFFLVAAVVQSCSQMPRDKMQAIEVRSFDTYMGEEIYSIYYLNSYRVIKKPVRQDSFVKQFQIDTITDKLISETRFVSSNWRNQYFVFEKHKNYALQMDSNNRCVDFRVRVDSLLEALRGTNRWDSFLKLIPDTSVQKLNGAQLEEVYVFPPKDDMPFSRLRMLYSKHLNHLEESFNSIVDSVKKMKLYKTEYIIEPHYNEMGKSFWPLAKSITEMREIEVKNSNEILKYINEYKKATRLHFFK